MAVFSQTWIETSVHGLGGVMIEYTVISQDQYYRFLNELEEENSQCYMFYTEASVLEQGGEIISVTRPDFIGFYLLYGILYYTQDEWFPIIAIGDGDTGRPEMDFRPLAGSFKVNSPEYKTAYNN